MLILIETRIRKTFYKKKKENDFLYPKEKIFTPLANVLSVTESF